MSSAWRPLTEPARSREHLGASDKGVIAVRRYLLEAIKGLQEGREPPGTATDSARSAFPNADCIREVIDGRDWRAAFPHLVRSVDEAREPAGAR